MSTRKELFKERSYKDIKLPRKRQYKITLDGDSDNSVEEIEQICWTPPAKKKFKSSTTQQSKSKIGADQGTSEKQDSTAKQSIVEVTEEQKSTQVTSFTNSIQQSNNNQNSQNTEIQETKEEKPLEVSYQRKFVNIPSKVGFTHFLQQMIQEELEPNQCKGDLNIFKKKQFLNISLLQTRTPHIKKNKLSDKFERRDYAFYNLYVKKSNLEDLSKLQENQFPLDVDANIHYNDIEVEDMNELFDEETLIEESFGQTIKVEINFNRDNIGRFVKENKGLAKPRKAKVLPEKQETFLKENEYNKDPDLQNLDRQLKSFEREFKKTKEEIADLFVRVSGRFNKMRDFLEGKEVIEWNYLEDLALEKPEDSPEFQILLNSKGYDEISVRREFLHVQPDFQEEIRNNSE